MFTWLSITLYSLPCLIPTQLQSEWSPLSNFIVHFRRDSPSPLSSALDAWWYPLIGRIAVWPRHLITSWALSSGVSLIWEQINKTTGLVFCSCTAVQWAPECPFSLVSLHSWAGLGKVLRSWVGLCWFSAVGWGLLRWDHRTVFTSFTGWLLGTQIQQSWSSSSLARWANQLGSAGGLSHWLGSLLKCHDKWSYRMGYRAAKSFG